MLSDSAPVDPLPVIRSWLDEAAASGQRNPDALALATVDPQGLPSVRMVLMRGLSTRQGYAVFYTHYGSAKARDIDASGSAAGVIYWPGQGRQVRLEGRVTRSPAAESDAYFAQRPTGSQINAWVSSQSQPLVARSELTDRAEKLQLELQSQSPPAQPQRPTHWGGYRLWFSAVELWEEGADRFHDRIRYERDLVRTATGGEYGAGPWRHRRLQP